MDFPSARFHLSMKKAKMAKMPGPFGVFWCILSILLFLKDIIKLIFASMNFVSLNVLSPRVNLLVQFSTKSNKDLIMKKRRGLSNFLTRPKPI